MTHSIVVGSIVVGALVAPLAVALPTSTSATSPPAPVAPAPEPAPKALPPQLDAIQQYQGQSICDPVDKPGIAKLRDLLLTTYGKRTIYTIRKCAADPTSEHTEGRALDWMVSIRNPQEKVQAEAFLKWLLRKGPDGSFAPNARRMGIMYMGWNNQIWRAYSPKGWGELKGCYSKPAKSQDTFCHRDHIHFSMTWDGAASQTSYWDGTAETAEACPSPRSKGTVRLLPAVQPAIPVAPKTILDTRTGAGIGKLICRLQEDRWSGDGHRLDVVVAGKGGVPKQGSAAAVLEITAVGPNAPMAVTTWPTGRKRPFVPATAPKNPKPVIPTQLTTSSTMRTLTNVTTTSTATVPIGAGGAVSIATATGDTHVTVRVVGYLKAGQ